MKGLILSIFPGIDILGRAFEEEGYCVVRGPDKGGDVEKFKRLNNAYETIMKSMGKKQ